MKVVLLANWGLGLSILKTIHQMRDIEIAFVVTRYVENSNDKWVNVVHEFALAHEYETFNQNNVSFEWLRTKIKDSNIDLLITHAYMKKLPEDVFTAPKYGSINIHPSLLPKYRGPSPTVWVIKKGEEKTGLSCHYIDRGIDTGDLIYQIEIPVEKDDTVETIIEKQKLVVDKIIIESLARIANSGFKPIPQDHKKATYFPKYEIPV
jgi:methionyl-tRNA formyltransferase